MTVFKHFLTFFQSSEKRGIYPNQRSKTTNQRILQTLQWNGLNFKKVLRSINMVMTVLNNNFLLKRYYENTDLGWRIFLPLIYITWKQLLGLIYFDEKVLLFISLDENHDSTNLKSHLYIDFTELLAINLYYFNTLSISRIKHRHLIKILHFRWISITYFNLTFVN